MVIKIKYLYLKRPGMTNSKLERCNAQEVKVVNIINCLVFSLIRDGL